LPALNAQVAVRFGAAHHARPIAQGRDRASTRARARVMGYYLPVNSTEAEEPRCNDFLKQRSARFLGGEAAADVALVLKLKYARHAAQAGEATDETPQTTIKASAYHRFRRAYKRCARVDSCTYRCAAMDPRATCGLRTGCHAALQSVRPGCSTCFGLYVGEESLFEPRVSRRFSGWCKETLTIQIMSV
jgi:hypothetical protein